MKKTTLWIVVAVIVVAGVAAAVYSGALGGAMQALTNPVPVYSCTDSDIFPTTPGDAPSPYSTINYFLRGTASGQSMGVSYSSTDICTKNDPIPVHGTAPDPNSERLREFYCSGVYVQQTVADCLSYQAVCAGGQCKCTEGAVFSREAQKCICPEGQEWNPVEKKCEGKTCDDTDMDGGIGQEYEIGGICFSADEDGGLVLPHKDFCAGNVLHEYWCGSEGGISPVLDLRCVDNQPMDCTDYCKQPPGKLGGQYGFFATGKCIEGDLGDYCRCCNNKDADDGFEDGDNPEVAGDCIGTRNTMQELCKVAPGGDSTPTPTDGNSISTEILSEAYCKDGECAAKDYDCVAYCMEKDENMSGKCSGGACVCGEEPKPEPGECDSCESCQALIDEGKSVKLTNDIEIENDIICLRVSEKRGITIDCGGYSISTRDLNTGIEISDSNQIKITGCKIYGVGIGVNIGNNSSHNIVEDCSFLGSSGTLWLGVAIGDGWLGGSGSNGNIIKNNTFEDVLPIHAYGFVFGNTIVSSNTIRCKTGHTGISVSAGGGTVENNNISNCMLGITLDSTNGDFVLLHNALSDNETNLRFDAYEQLSVAATDNYWNYTADCLFENLDINCMGENCEDYITLESICADEKCSQTCPCPEGC